jgi:hypothetical protein
MTSKEFFTGRTIGFVVLIIVGLIYFGYKTYLNRNPEPSVEIKESTSNIDPIFTWKYEPDDSLNPDGLPQTNVYLEASYDGDVVRKLIFTAPGGCNDLPEKEKDSVPNSTVAQCYAAGYGDLFKITRGEKSFLVMHKIFEEGSPEYTPNETKYTAIAEFPFTK